MNRESKYLDQIIPRKYGNKERFRPDEVKEILDVKETRTLRGLDRKLQPIKLSERKKVYPRQNIEEYLRKQNS